MTRMPPEHVVKALTAYDPDLGLTWDPDSAVWKFTHRGTPFMSWVHRGGGPARADTPVGEALSLIKEVDNRNDGGIRLRAMNARIKRRQERRKREQQAAKEEASAEAYDRSRVKMRGPRPFVSGAV